MMHREARRREFDLARLFNHHHRIVVMGVVNTTPDSFSDGGTYFDRDAAAAQALRLVEQGADIIDIGGESSRPGAIPVSESEERQRVLPVIDKLSGQCPVPISIDTTKASVARAALETGASIVNDITALNGDSDMAGVVAEFGAGLVLMHMRGTPQQMQLDTSYDDLVGEILAYLSAAIVKAESAGVAPNKIIVDPGIGFGKDLEGNLSIIRSIPQFRSLGKPVMVGASRKSFIGRLSGAGTGNRLPGSLAAATAAVLNGASAVRVHDVAETRQAVDLAFRLRGTNNGTVHLQVPQIYSGRSDRCHGRGYHPLQVPFTDERHPRRANDHRPHAVVRARILRLLVSTSRRHVAVYKSCDSRFHRSGHSVPARNPRSSGPDRALAYCPFLLSHRRICLRR